MLFNMAVFALLNVALSPPGLKKLALNNRSAFHVLPRRYSLPGIPQSGIPQQGGSQHG